MSTLFSPILEKRYADYPRRYSNEYHMDARRKRPDAKGSCATLVSARSRAVRAIELGYCATVRVFDRKTGQYVYTYKGTPKGLQRSEGYEK